MYIHILKKRNVFSRYIHDDKNFPTNIYMNLYMPLNKDKQ